ncbi:group II intron maturase-specific domain-containing protein [Caenimonas soli]|uniref:group II intron maturase-specific domain-containing protein n=1 Tax=Caenimonas soli TaxID=2735555 RepID=UPI0038B3F81C
MLEGLRRCYGRLRLKVNETKTAVAPVWRRKFVGCSLIRVRGEVRLAVAKEAVQRYRRRVRELTPRQTGRSIAQIVQGLRVYVQGWKNYFQLAPMPRGRRDLDEWMRHRLRAIQLKHWGRPATVRRELRALGASEDTAKQVAANVRRWWRNSTGAINRVLDLAYFENLGAPRLC